MADLSSIERRKLERLLRMGGGYVLDFSDRTFSEFFEEHTRRDIDAAIYRERGTSKANRLRGFWAAEGNHLVGKVIQALILYGQAENCLGDEPGLTELTDDCRKIASRMMRDTPVAELDELTATVDERDFETVAQHLREAIEKNQPEAALDRLHTFVKWTVDSMVEHTHLSRNGFAQEFRNVVGITPANFLTRVRTALAQRLLHKGRPVALVAEEVGYGSQPAFSRAFIRETGMSPSAWVRTITAIGS